MLIALDTSTAWCSLALYDAGRGELADERNWRTGTDHNRHLLPQIDQVVRSRGLSPRDLTGIGVAIGPGTFNGVRIAVSTAKLLARTLGIPVCGVDTLEIYAAPWRGSGLLVRPIVGAARGEIGTALFRCNRTIERLEPTRLAIPSDVLVPPIEPTVFVGEIDEHTRTLITAVGADGRLAGPDQSVRRAGALAVIAAERLAAGEPDTAEYLAPIYLRPPHITQPRR